MRAWRVVGLAVGVAGLAAWGWWARDRIDPAWIPAPGTYDVRIVRDAWGVPHIFGKTDADAAYGLAWAHCEDDWGNMEDALLAVRSRIASKHGKEEAKFDYVGQLFRVRRFVEEGYARDIPAEVRAIAEAYAAGATHFAATHRDKMPHVELPATGRDVVAGFVLKAPFFYELQRQLEEIMGPARKRPVSQKQALLPVENPLTDGREIGSNAFAVAPSRSADGATRLAINSHQPWDGQVAWYEAVVHSEQGWNVAGGTFPGGPVLFNGVDEHKGWAHTVNRPDLCDVYALEMNPENANQYRFDGQWRDLEVDDARITVKLWGPVRWTVKREVLWSVHGPAVRTEHGVYALRFAGLGNLRALEQWYRMNKARNLDEFKAAMQVQGLPSFNTVYADRTGNIWYVYNGHFPERAPGYDWQQYLPGNTSETLWNAFLPFERVPQVLNPPAGYVQSCNATPFEATQGEGNLRPEDFPDWMGIETRTTNRATRLNELLGSDASIAREEFYAYKYDKRYSTKSDVGRRFAKLCTLPNPEDPKLRAALALLRTWDLSTDADNRAAPLGVMACEPRMVFEEDKPRAKDPLEAVRKAAEFLERHFGRIEVPWGEYARLRRGGHDLPLGGAPDVLRAIRGETGEDGRMAASYGDCLIIMAEWDAAGALRAESIHQYGAATLDAASPHYGNQAPLFAVEKMKPVWLREADLRAHAAREYRPGESSGAWYER